MALVGGATRQPLLLLRPRRRQRTGDGCWAERRRTWSPAWTCSNSCCAAADQYYWFSSRRRSRLKTWKSAAAAVPPTYSAGHYSPSLATQVGNLVIAYFTLLLQVTVTPPPGPEPESGPHGSRSQARSHRHGDWKQWPPSWRPLCTSRGVTQVHERR